MDYKINTVYIISETETSTVWNEQGEGSVESTNNYIARVYATREEAEKYIAAIRDEYLSILQKDTRPTIFHWDRDLVIYGRITYKDRKETVEKRIEFELLERTIDNF